MPYLERSGVRLHYSDSGSGPAILFQTGGAGDAQMFRSAGYLDALPGRRHLLFDHRGHGRSDRPESVAQHRIAEYVADVIAVMDAAGVERAALVGYSDGGNLFFTLAADHPGRVAAVVCIGGVVHPDDTNQYRLDGASNLRQHGVRQFIADIEATESEAPPDWLIENFSATSAEMMALELEGWADSPTAFADFSRITAPVLIVCGEQENFDGSAELAVAALPDGRAVILPGFGHLQAFWHAEVTAPYIADFLDAHVPAGIGEPLKNGLG